MAKKSKKIGHPIFALLPTPLLRFCLTQPPRPFPPKIGHHLCTFPLHEYEKYWMILLMEIEWCVCEVLDTYLVVTYLQKEKSTDKKMSLLSSKGFLTPVKSLTVASKNNRIKIDRGSRNFIVFYLSLQYKKQNKNGKTKRQKTLKTP